MNGKYANKPEYMITKQQEGFRVEARCYNCNRTGHMVRKCLQPKRERVTCYDCGEKGHFSRDCPRKDKRQVAHVYEDPEEDFRRNVMFEIADSKLPRALCLNTLLDTRSPVSFLKERFVSAADIELVNDSDYHYHGINDFKLTIRGKVAARITLGGDSRDGVTILVVPENTMVASAVLGRDVLKIERTLYLI